MNKFSHPLLIIILIISFGLRLFVLYFLPISQKAAEPLLLSQLVNHAFLIPSWLIIAFGSLNVLLIFAILKKITSVRIGLISALLYAISPWIAYLEVAGSLYIFLITHLLLFILGLLFLNNQRKVVGFSLVCISSLSLIYSSLVMWIVLPILIFSLTKLNYINRERLKIYILLIVILILPTLLLLKDTTVLKIILSREISLFSNVGLINAVNTFRGETNQTQFAAAGKYIENRYFYLSEHLLFNLLKHISPVTYFTSEFKMLSFSFSPPIFVGFLIPLLMGLNMWFKLGVKFRWGLFMVLALLLPSILSVDSPNMNRLVLVSPIIFLLISLGMEELLKRKNISFKFLILVTLILVSIQGLTTLSDILKREPTRLQKSQPRI